MNSITKILMLGPFPKPIHGMSLANQILFDSFSKRDDLKVSKIDITVGKFIKDKENQGRFDFFYVIRSLRPIFLAIFYIIINPKCKVYITPPQSILGLLRISPVVLISWLFSTRLVLHFHGSKLLENSSMKGKLVFWIVKFILSLADKVIFLGPSIVESHKKLIKKDNFTFCFNGVPFPLGVVNKNRNGRLNVLFLSNLMKDKGIFDFIEAVEAINEINNIDISFHLAGELEPTYAALLESRISRLGDNVHYHGIVEGAIKDKLFSSSHVFILPSYDEGQPLSILEAYSYGCYVITTNVGGIKDIFTDGLNGVYCALGSSQSIVECLLTLDKETFSQVSNYNKSHYIEMFSSDSFVKRISSMLEI